jgi:hypothetical protein
MRIAYYKDKVNKFQLIEKKSGGGGVGGGGGGGGCGDGGFDDSTGEHKISQLDNSFL